MTTPGDDLPRSPSGRVPQWLVDEAAGRPVETPAWRTATYELPAPPRRRPSVVVRLARLVVLAAVGAWALVAVLPGALSHIDSPWLDRVVVGRVPEPTPEIAALADEMFLTPDGRDLLYRSRPELLDAAEFAGRCDRPQEGSGAVGCFHHPGGTTVNGAILVYEPADPRLRGFVIEVAAHELLHAAWLELSPGERAEASDGLEQVVAGLDPADDIHAQIVGSVGASPENRATELYAYVGTQVWQPGGLDPRLEELYGRVVADREALVAVHTAAEAQLDATVAEVEAAQAALASRQMVHMTARAQYDADVATVAAYRAEVEQEAARFAAMSGGERARWTLSWTWHDGTVLPPASAEETLATARELLARDEAALAVRAVELRVEEEAVAAEEARVEAVRAEVEGLYAQLSPGATG